MDWLQSLANVWHDALAALTLSTYISDQDEVGLAFAQVLGVAVRAA